jgi:hypothetical protein
MALAKSIGRVSIQLKFAIILKKVEENNKQRAMKQRTIWRKNQFI